MSDMKPITHTDSESNRTWDAASLALVVYVMLIGLAIRLVPVLSAAAPLNDGGLFYIMLRDLQANHYLLPAYTTYNAANIPFAYPPLGFYLTGLISDLFRWPLLDTMRVFPVILNVLTIPVFFLFSRELLRSKTQAALATILFSLAPRMFEWRVMGGGITRAPGLIFALLTLYQIHRLYTTQKPKHILLSILFGAGVVLTHPEAAVQTALGVFVLFVFKGRNRKAFFHSLAVASGILLLTSIWWGNVIAKHSVDPFVAVMGLVWQDTISLPMRFVVLFTYEYTEEPYITLIAVFSLVGLFACLANKRFLLPTWLVISQLLEPRSGQHFAIIPVALFTGIALDEIFLPGLRKLHNREAKNIPVEKMGNWLSQLLDTGIVKAVLGFIFIYCLFSAAYTILRIASVYTLRAEDVSAMQWIRDNTPPGSRFLVLTNASALLDPTSDWFPALSERASLTTVFGYEWLADGQFGSRTASYRQLQDCLYQDTACLETWALGQDIAFDYVHIRKAGIAVNSLEFPVDYPLIASLSRAPDYQVAYDSPMVIIFSSRFADDHTQP